MSRVSQQRLAAVRAGLSDRDRAILGDLARVRCLSARQVERLNFQEGSALTQARRSRRTLERLTRLGVLHRFERQIGGVRAGSAGYVYGLSALGQRLVDADGPAGGERRRSPWEPSTNFMAHVLAVSEVYVQLREAERRRELELLAFDAEPRSWRWDSVSRSPVVKPDAFVAVGIGRYEERRFLEVDLGTESRPVLKRKAKAYVDYWDSGVEQHEHGVFPRVLFVTDSEQRKEVIVTVLGDLPAEAWTLFQVGEITQTLALFGSTDTTT